ncbi:MAG: hypothetical protein KDD37_09540 [Bdellovibrionales bacterium]|nr:hypothetical protein [Bdellovibrionales bacterium]
MQDKDIIRMGADPKDYHRSSVSKRIFALAQENQLLFAHYEYRWPVPVPEHWLHSSMREEGQGASYWQSGVLFESKYQAFRHDSAVCNFHPGQSSKWGAHELCHKLVGYAWRPNENLLFHTLAAWTAEVLPVVVYYFWDEIDSYKCDVHRAHTMSPTSYCVSCEAISEVTKETRSQQLQAGWDFLNTQLLAIEESLQKQRIISAPYFSLNLADDAYHYSLSQLERLNSDVYIEYMKEAVPATLYTQSIEDLIKRVRYVASALMDNSSFSNYNISRENWAYMDISFRGLELAESMDTELKSIFLKQVRAYIKTKKLDAFLAEYQALQEDYEMPSAREFFGTGYEINNEFGFYKEQIIEGLQSLLPNTYELLNDDEIDEFVKSDRGNREYLGQRIQGHFKIDAIEVEAFINQPQGFFEKSYGAFNVKSKFKWSNRARIFKNSKNIEALIEQASPYVLLFKSINGEILSYNLSDAEGAKLIKYQKQTFYLDELKVSLEDADFYVQNHILVEAREG